MSDIINLSIKELHYNLKNKVFTAVELTKAYLAKNDNINAFITKTPELALDMARRADQAIAQGRCTFMTGIPLGIKDMFCTRGVLTTAASKMLSNFVSPYEATVTHKLFAQNAVMLGKTNMDEFAMGSANRYSYYGSVCNPWQTQCVPGGSSGGSAAAVAARLCAGALGSDTGGSVRQPAAFCGVVGVKPTYGRCSRWGMIAFASSLDQAGVLTRTVTDALLMLATICGYDEKDSRSFKVSALSTVINSDIKGKKIGIIKQYKDVSLIPEMQNLWQNTMNWLQERGAEIVEVDLSYIVYSLPVYYILSCAEAATNLARYDGVRYGLRINADTLDEMYTLTRSAGFGSEVKRRILLGTYVLSAGYYEAYYKQADLIRNLIIQDFVTAFEKVEAILTLTTPNEAFAIDKVIDPLTMYLNDLFTIPASLAGLPAISVPVALSSHGLPLGIQLISNYYQENTLCNFAKAVEEEARFNNVIH